jgi:acyl carrier protein
MSSIERQVRKLIAERLGRNEEEVTRDASFDELGGDSLGSVELLLALEDEFQVDIPDEEAERIITVRHITEFLTFHAGRIERTGASRRRAV